MFFILHSLSVISLENDLIFVLQQELPGQGCRLFEHLLREEGQALAHQRQRGVEQAAHLAYEYHIVTYTAHSNCSYGFENFASKFDRQKLH